MKGFSLRQRTSRVGFLDEARGLCLLLMVLYHGAYDIIYLFHINIPIFHWPIIRWAQPFFAGIFILISGICCRYSRSNRKRGLIAFGFGLALTLFTVIAMPAQAIYFGILHFMGIAMITFSILENLLDKLACFWGLCLMLLLFAFTWGVPQGTVGFFGLLRFPLPVALYQTSFLFPLGFPGPGFATADYFPFFPWIFCFLAGSYLGVFFRQGDMPKGLYRTRSDSLAWVGRHSILIYILHQPVVYGVLYGFFWLLSLVGLY